MYVYHVVISRFVCCPALHGAILAAHRSTLLVVDGMTEFLIRRFTECILDFIIFILFYIFNFYISVGFLFMQFILYVFISYTIVLLLIFFLFICFFSLSR